MREGLLQCILRHVDDCGQNHHGKNQDNGQQAIPIGPTGKQRPQAGHDHPHAEKTEDDGGNACEQFYRWADNTTQPAGCKLREEYCG